MVSLSESSSMWTSGDESIDKDETWMLSGEVKLLEKKWEELPPYFLGGRAFAEREIMDPPKYKALFIPKRTSSPLRNKSLNETEKKELERYNKFLEEMEHVEEQRKQRKRVPKPFWPDPETPENYWNPGWNSPPKEENKE